MSVLFDRERDQNRLGMVENKLKTRQSFLVNNAQRGLWPSVETDHILYDFMSVSDEEFLVLEDKFFFRA